MIGQEDVGPWAHVAQRCVERLEQGKRALKAVREGVLAQRDAHDWHARIHGRKDFE